MEPGADVPVPGPVPDEPPVATAPPAGAGTATPLEIAARVPLAGVTLESLPPSAPAGAPRWDEVFRETSVALAVNDPATNRITYATPAYARMHGYAPHEVVGLSIFDLYPPEARAGLPEHIRRANAERVHAFESVHLRRDGSTFPVRVDARAVVDAGGRLLCRVVTCEDLTEQKRALAALRESEARLRVTFDEAPVGIAQVGLDGRTLRVNRALADLLGYTPAELEALSFADVTHPDDLARDRVEMARMLAGEAAAASYEKRYLRRDGGVVWTRLTVSAVRGAEGRPEYVVGVVEDVTPWKRAAERLRVLADAGRALAATLDVRRTLEALARLALPGFADYCTVDLLRGDGTIERAVGAHVVPEKERLLVESARRFSHVDQRGPAEAVRGLMGGSSVLLPEITPALVDLLIADPEYRALIRAVGPRSHLVVPLAAGERVLGALSFGVSESDRRYDGEDLALAEELGRRGAAALESARLLEEAEAARLRAEAEARRVGHLQALTTALAGAATPVEVAAVALERARPTFGAAAGFVNLLSDDGTELVNLRAAGFSAAQLAPWRRYPVQSGTPGGEVVRTGEPVVVRSLDEVERRFPVLAAPLRAAGLPSFTTFPLRVEERVLGLVAFNFSGERDFGPEELGLMATFAGQCAQAMERARLFEAERRARAEAEEANQAKMQFLATMSHELRTPLNAIAGYVELLHMGLHGPVTDEQRHALERVRHSQRHLLSLINDVLNFARIEAGRVELRPAEVPVRELLTGLEALVEPQLRAKRLRFARAECDPAVRAWADAEKVRQVVLNLLSNAIKYTPAEGLVTVGAAEEDGVVRVRVRDTGIGIAADKLETVFEPFVQLGRSLTSAHEGTGLGLSISRDLARAMGGDLTAESEPGVGSTFMLTLPRAGTG